MSMSTPMFEVSEIADLLRRLQCKGVKIAWRPATRLKTGGTWVAQISRDGWYLRVRNTDPIRAIRTLADRYQREPKPSADGTCSRYWRKWAAGWAKDNHANDHDDDTADMKGTECS